MLDRPIECGHGWPGLHMGGVQVLRGSSCACLIQADASLRVCVAVGILFLFYLAAGEAILVLPWAGLILVAVFVGVSAWTIRRVQSRVPDLREQRGEWGRWLLILFILEELAAGILMVAVALAMLFALFFESGLSSRDFDRTPFLMIIGGFLVLSMSILVWAVRQWALRSWTCFAVPLLVPVAALISSSLWNSLM